MADNAEVRQGLFAFCPCCLREVGQQHKATCPDAVDDLPDDWWRQRIADAKWATNCDPSQQVPHNNAGSD